MKNAAPAVSVIVPVYNAAPWLERCLQGIADQTCPDWECILVDDGSTDASGAICDAWQQKDARFTVVHQPNGGVSAARNRGMALAQGAYLAFCDADDLYAPRTLEYALMMQAQNPEAMVIWGFTDDESRFLAENEPHSFAVLPKAAFDGLAWMEILYNSSCNRLFDGAKLRGQGLQFRDELGRAGAAVICEDGEFVARYLRQCAPADGWQIAYCPQPLYYYAHDNAASLSTTATGAPSGELPLREGLEETLRTEWQALLDTVPDFPNGYPLQPDTVARYYLATTAQWLGQCRLRGQKPDKALLHHPCLGNILRYCKQNRLYSPYYLPLKTGLYGLAGRMWQMEAEKNRNFGRLDWLGYYLLGGKWNRV